MAGIKIVDLPALGRDLLSTDLLEMSIGGTASRKITGQEIMNASKLNVGSTPIVSGTVGRLLFQGTGNVLQQSSSLFWDSTNNRLGIGTSTPFGSFDVRDGDIFATISSNANLRSRLTYQGLYVSRSTDGTYTENIISTTSAWLYNSRNSHSFFRDGTNLFNVGVALSSGLNINAAGNILIGTTTDAGFKLDVNGTARVSGATTINNRYLYHQGNSAIQYFMTANAWSGTNTIYFGDDSSSTIGNITYNHQFDYLAFSVNAAERMRIFSTGNIGINTTTDDGFRLDVNGTARARASSGSYVNVLTVENTGSASVDFKNVATFIGNRGNASNIDDNTCIGLQQKSNIANNYGVFNFFNAGGNLSAFFGAQFVSHGTAQNGNLVFGTATSGSPSTKMTLFSTGNVGINTTTDAGYKLDVNGTARVSGNLTFGFNTTYITTSSTGGGINAGINTFFNNGAIWIDDTSVRALDITYNNGIKIANTTRYPLSLGTSSKAVASAQLEMVSTTQGFLPPRMTNAQRTAIVSPAVGLIVYCTDVTEGLWVYKSTGWTFIV